MYPNLKAELARNKMTIKDLSEKLNIKYSTLKNKVSGITDFKCREMYLIKKDVFPDQTVDYLFEENKINKFN